MIVFRYEKGFGFLHLNMAEKHHRKSDKKLNLSFQLIRREKMTSYDTFNTKSIANPPNFYLSHPKDGEGNVFTLVCLFTGEGGGTPILAGPVTGPF